MTRLQGKSRAELAEFEPLFQLVERSMGFLPNSMLAMANWPELLQAFSGLGGVVLMGGELDPGLKQLIAFVTSNASGCRYCQAHTSHVALRRGVSEEKLAAAFELESSACFSEAERAALRVAQHAGLCPNAVEDGDFEELRKHYSERQMTEIMGVIAYFGFLNRWNDSLATVLEQPAREHAEQLLSGRGWLAGKHG